MLFKKNENVAMDAKNEKTPLDWEATRLSMIELAEARAWMCVKILCVTCIALACGIALMMPLKESVPFVIEVDKSTGLSTLLKIANTDEIPVSELMDKYWLKEYVLARESYDYRTLENDYLKTRELSMPNVFEPYASQFGTEKDSLEMQLKDRKRITVELLSVVPNGNGVATVRFLKRLSDTGTGKVEAEDGWTARIGYEYVPTFTVEEAKRLVNPFGFKVTSYRVDQELQ